MTTPDDIKPMTVTIWQALLAAALIVTGVGFVWWPGAFIAAGALLAVDVIFDLRGEK